MTAIRLKEIGPLLDHLVAQGARTKPCRNGTRVLFSDGSSTVIHRSESDPRALLNLRARVKRAGLTWPSDETTTKGSEMSNLSSFQLADLDAAITAAAPGPVKPATIAASTGIANATVRTYLGKAGWVQDGPHGQWRKPTVGGLTAAPAAPPMIADIQRELAQSSSYSGPPAKPTYERRAVKWGDPDVGPGSGTPLASIPLPTQPAGLYANRTDGKRTGLTPNAARLFAGLETLPEQREFIDSTDSWTIEVPRKLQELAAAAGLQIEVRVWREKSK